MANPVAGWYQDPSGDPTKLRWWDGTQWTDNYADARPFRNQPLSSLISRRHIRILLHSPRMHRPSTRKRKRSIRPIRPCA